MRPIILFLHECNACGAVEERIFTDSWTGKEICLACLGPVADRITNSPASEGDNLQEIIDFEEED